MTSQPVRRTVLTVHIAASAGLVGAAGVLAALGLSGVRGDDPRTVYPAMHLVESRVVAPLAVVALATGLLLSRQGRWDLLADRWLTVKLVVTVVLTAAVFAVLLPVLSDASAAALDGVPPDAAQRRRLLIVPLVAVALLVSNVALVVFKPGSARGRRTRAAQAAELADAPAG